jgi:hypothetical protein
MDEFLDPRKPATAFDHATTLVAVLELSGKSWEMGASMPGVVAPTSAQASGRGVGGGDQGA